MGRSQDSLIRTDHFSYWRIYCTDQWMSGYIYILILPQMGGTLKQSSIHHSNKEMWKYEQDLLRGSKFLHILNHAGSWPFQGVAPRLHLMLASRSRRHRPYVACSAGLIVVGRVGWIMVPKRKWWLTSTNSGGIRTTSYENGRDNKTAVMFQDFDFNVFCECWKWGFFVRYSIRLVQQVPWLYIRVFSWKCLKCSRSWRNQTNQEKTARNRQLQVPLTKLFALTKPWHEAKSQFQSYRGEAPLDFTIRMNSRHRLIPSFHSSSQCSDGNQGSQIQLWFASYLYLVVASEVYDSLPPRMRPGPATRIIQQKPWLNAVRSEFSWSRSLADGCHVSTKTMSPGSLLTKEVCIPMT